MKGCDQWHQTWAFHNLSCLSCWNKTKHELCTHYCLFVSCNLDKWYNIKLKVVESQAVGRRKQATGAPYPLIPRDSLKTPELYLQCWGLRHSVMWLSVYLRLWGCSTWGVAELYHSLGGHCKKAVKQVAFFFLRRICGCYIFGLLGEGSYKIICGRISSLHADIVYI